MTTRHYSHLFSCLYDQPEAVGSLGRGTHHSIFRSVQWREIDGALCPNGRIHDFAIIWDEDHDERVIRVAERLHLATLLWPVVFLGERKGTLTILIDYMGAAELLHPESNLLSKMESIASAATEADEWPVEIGLFQRMQVVGEENDTNPKRIIADDHDRVVRYLQGIDALWKLGDRE